MKKIVLALVVLMFAAPAWASVDIYCTDLGDGKVLLSFDASSEPNLVRAFGLNIQCDNDANIVDVNDNINPDYWVFPGTIIITGNVVTYQGTAVGEYSDLPSDTMRGPPDSNMTLEMATLYYPPDGPGSPNAPDPCAPLVTFTVDKATCITISGNVARAGSTGVVMESPDETPTVNLTGCCVEFCNACSYDLNNDGYLGPEDVGAYVTLLSGYAGDWYYIVSTSPDYDECLDANNDGYLGPEDVGALVTLLSAYSGDWYYVLCDGAPLP